jgi:sporulation protein YlmC with PRC-barrel domain
MKKEWSMLRSVNEIQGYRLQATDGEIGKVKDFLFEDENWTVLYLVADTGGWLPGKKVLISPAAFKGHPDHESRHFPVNMSTEMVENSPDISSNEPYSRQRRREGAQYYRWSSTLYAHPLIPASVVDTEAQGFMVPGGAVREEQPAEQEETRVLRSAGEVSNYAIQASDGELGEVEDFILDDDTWRIMYMVVDTRKLLPGKKVLIARLWISDIDWLNSLVHVDMSRDEIKGSPEFDPSAPVNREYEKVLYDYYGRPRYWEE